MLGRTARMVFNRLTQRGSAAAEKQFIRMLTYLDAHPNICFAIQLVLQATMIVYIEKGVARFESYMSSRSATEESRTHDRQKASKKDSNGDA